jgi:hypothetical protein
VNNLLENFMDFVKNSDLRQEMTDILAKSPEQVRFHSSFRDSHPGTAGKPHDIDPFEIQLEQADQVDSPMLAVEDEDEEKDPE